MWNTKKSTWLSLLFVYLFIGVFVFVEAGAPWVTAWYLGLVGRTMELQTVLMAFIYACLLPLGWALWLLVRLLHAIRQGQGFSALSVRCLRHLSWCCLLMVPITLAVGFWYLPIMILCPFAAFLFLLLRVLKNAFAAALELQTENDMTI